MFMKTFSHSTRELLPGELIHTLETEVNSWVRSTASTFKVMNISPPTVIHDRVIITVVYVER